QNPVFANRTERIPGCLRCTDLARKARRHSRGTITGGAVGKGSRRTGTDALRGGTLELYRSTGSSAGALSGRTRARRHRDQPPDGGRPALQGAGRGLELVRCAMDVRQSFSTVTVAVSSAP